MDAVTYFLALSATSLLGFLALKYLDKRLAYVFGILFAIYVGLDDLVTGLGGPSSDSSTPDTGIGPGRSAACCYR